jgi:hypothetical protein
MSRHPPEPPWLVALVLLVRAATAASQGQDYTFPGWLCSPIVH